MSALTIVMTFVMTMITVIVTSPRIIVINTIVVMICLDDDAMTVMMMMLMMMLMMVSSIAITITMTVLPHPQARSLRMTLPSWSRRHFRLCSLEFRTQSPALNLWLLEFSVLEHCDMLGT